jgi:negative regulator of flagellin synthesis FlgM
MLTTSGPISPISVSKAVRPTKAAYTAKTNLSNTNYDSADFSTYTGGSNAAHMNLVSRLSQEVRTATTTADIRELRQQVASGTYQPDPAAIAKRMLFATEE